jgi:hydrogenase nickel insertion protein HypA
MTMTWSWIRARRNRRLDAVAEDWPRASVVSLARARTATEGRSVMHEQALSQALLDAVQNQAGGRCVTAVRARIGARLQVDPEALTEAFAEASTGTVAEGAPLELTVAPVHSTCRVCGQTYVADTVPSTCAACSASEFETSGADALVLEAINMPWWEAAEGGSATAWEETESEASGPCD